MTAWTRHDGDQTTAERLAEFADALVGEINPERVGRLALDAIVALSGADGGEVFTTDARGESVRIASVGAPSDGSIAASSDLRVGDTVLGRITRWGGGTNDGPSLGFAQGANTVGFDCSGLTMFAYHKAGIQLGHYTGSQWDQGKRISSMADLQPGDLMYFAYDTSDPSTIHHVALYLGNGMMISAPQTGEVVKVSSASRSDFIGATRPWQR